MENDFIIFRIFKRITDFSNLVGYPPNPPDQLTINIYKIKKILSSLIFNIFNWTLIFFTNSLSSLISQSSKSWSSTAIWSSIAMGISSSSLLPISISLSLSHFLFCFITGEGRSCRTPPLAKGDHVKLHRHGEVPDPRSSKILPDLVRSRQIWRVLVGSGEISPDFGQTSLILLQHHLQLRRFCPILVYLLFFFFFFFCGCYGEFFCCGDLLMFFVGLIFYLFVVVTTKTHKTRP